MNSIYYLPFFIVVVVVVTSFIYFSSLIFLYLSWTLFFFHLYPKRRKNTKSRISSDYAYAADDENEDNDFKRVEKYSLYLRLYYKRFQVDSYTDLMCKCVHFYY